MTHSKRLLILLYISILLREISSSKEIPGGIHKKIDNEAEKFFDYTLCDISTEETSGLKWTCLIPDYTSGGRLTGMLSPAEVEKSDVVLAIQHVKDWRWRVIMQVHNKASLDLVDFAYGPNNVVECRLDGTNVVTAQTLNIFGSPFSLTQKPETVKGRYKAGDKFMCEFIMETAQNKIMYEWPDSTLDFGIAWEEMGVPKYSARDFAGVKSAMKSPIENGCLVKFDFFVPQTPGEEHKEFDMDRKTITCSEGFTLMGRREGDQEFSIITKAVCNMNHEFMVNGVRRGTQGDAYCAKKTCQTCEDPCKKGAVNCKPTNATGFEGCTTLTCGSSKLYIGSEDHSEGTLTCDADKKWKLDGHDTVVVKDVSCGEQRSVKCDAPRGFIKIKDDDMDKMSISPDDSVVTCKAGNMSYTLDGKGVKLTNLTCNAGKWLETRVDPAGTADYTRDHELECTVAGAADAAPKTSGMIYYGVGGALALALIILAAILIYCCCCKRKKKKGGAEQSGSRKSKSSKKSSKSKESKSKESKSNMPSSSGPGGVGVQSSDKSDVTQKNSSRKEREKMALAIGGDTQEVATGVSIDPRTGLEIKDEERSNPTERSAIPKTEDLKDMQTGVAGANQKTAAGAGAPVEQSAKNPDEEDDEEPAALPEGATQVGTAAKRTRAGTRTRNVDGTQAQTTLNADGTQAQSTMGPDGTQAATMQQKRRAATKRGSFMDTAMGNDPTRGPDGTQQASENGPDEAGTQMATNATAETQAATLAARTRLQRGRRTQQTQQGGEEEEQELATAVDNTEDAQRRRTQQTQNVTRDRTRDRTRMMTAADAGQTESAAIDPQPTEMRTARDLERDDDTNPLNTAVGKARDRTVEKHTAETQPPEDLKPHVAELNEKEKKIKAGAKRNRNDYPTMKDIESDWDSDKDKRDKPKARKKSVEKEKDKKKKSKKSDEKKDSKKKDKEVKKKEKEEKKKDRKKAARSPAAAAGELREMTAVDDGPSGVTGNYYTAREQTARGDGTQALTPYDPTQVATSHPTNTTQRTRQKTRTVLTTAFDPTETHAAPTIADLTQAVTAQDPTQGGTIAPDGTQGATTLADRTTQGGFTTLADGTQGATTVADFTQAHTQGADPTQAGTTTIGHDRTQAQTTAADRTQADTRTKAGRTRGVSRTQTRTRADFTQAGTTAADFTQGGATTLADPTQQAHTAQDPTQAGTTGPAQTQDWDPTQARRTASADGSIDTLLADETQHQTRTMNDPTQLHSAETQQDGRRSKTKTALTARSGTRPGTTQTRTRADFTQDPTRIADGTQGATTLADQTQAHTAQDPTQAGTTVADGTQIGSKTKTRSRQPFGTQTATAGDRTQTQTRTRAKDPTQTETRGEETQQGQTELADGTQMPTKTATAGDRTQTATRDRTRAKDPTQTATQVPSRTQTHTAVDPTGTVTAVDPTHMTTGKDRTQTQTAVDPTGRTMTAVDRTRTETKDPTRKSRSKDQHRTQTMTAVDPTGTVTAVDPTHMTTGKDRTQTQTAVDPTGTVTAVDPTHITTAKDRTQTQTAVDPTRTGGSGTKKATRTQTATAAEQTQTNLERTKTAKDRTQTQTNADETQGHAATTLGQEQTQQAMTRQTTAKDKTQTPTKGERTQTATRGDKTQTATRDKTREGRTQQTSAANQTQQTAHDPTQGPTTAGDPTQTHNEQQ